MKNIIELKTRTDILHRLNSLSENDSPLWGKMSSNGMVCHCADQIKLAKGIITSPFIGNIFLTSIIKRLILAGVPTPKGKVETTPELKQGSKGTKPTSFENDKKTLLDLIEEYCTDKSNSDIIHPAFGLMNKKQWSRLIYLHLDHHLKQFNR